jgi:hypothetical protein
LVKTPDIEIQDTGHDYKISVKRRAQTMKGFGFGVLRAKTAAVDIQAHVNAVGKNDNEQNHQAGYGRKAATDIQNQARTGDDFK